MTVKVGSQAMSAPRAVNGGCSQGLILGVFLINTTIDDLEQDCGDLAETKERAPWTRPPDEEPERNDSCNRPSSTALERNLNRPSSNALERNVNRPSSNMFERSVNRPSSDALVRNVTSTPFRRARQCPQVASPVLRPWNPGGGKKKARRINYTNELDTTDPEEPNHWTEARWEVALAELLRYIDHSFCQLKVNFENSFGFVVNGQKFKVKHAIQAQNVFRHLVRRAVKIGMVVNAAKTAMILYRTQGEYDTMNRQHVRLIRDPFID